MLDRIRNDLFVYDLNIWLHNCYFFGVFPSTFALQDFQFHTPNRMSGRGRTLPLDFSPATGRNRCSPLIDRRHAKVWISMSQPPLIQPRSRPREQFHPQRGTSSISAFLIWAATPWEERGPATAKPRIISAYSSTCSDMASASSTPMPR